MRRFRILGASFSSFGCFVLRSSFSSASFSKLPQVTSGEAARKITLVTIKKTAHEKSLALRVTGLQRVT